MSNSSGDGLWAVIVGAVFIAAALVYLAPASWAVPVFFGVVGIALIIYWLASRS